MTPRPLESLALLVADLQRRVGFWRGLQMQAVLALHEKTLECENYRKESERKSRAIRTIKLAATRWGKRKQVDELVRKILEER